MPKQPVGRKCMTILMSNPITNKNFLFEEFSNSTVSDGILFDKEVQELTFLKKIGVLRVGQIFAPNQAIKGNTFRKCHIFVKNGFERLSFSILLRTVSFLQTLQCAVSDSNIRWSVVEVQIIKAILGVLEEYHQKNMYQPVKK